MTQPVTQIVFFSVRDTQDKLAQLCALAKGHFEKNDPLLIMATDEKARNFVDELLWRMPLDSFLPHVASDMPCRDLIVITCSRQNINQARTIFNLTPEPLLLEESGLTIYEFEEHYTEHRRKASEARYRTYRDKGCSIRMESASG